MRLPGVAAREAARSAQFWLMAGVFLLAGAAVNGANAHIVPLLTDRGLTPVAATGIFGVMGLSTLVVRPFVGLLLDRVFAPKSLPPSSLPRSPACRCSPAGSR